MSEYRSANTGLPGFLTVVMLSGCVVCAAIFGPIFYGIFKLGQNWHKVPSVRLEVVPVDSSK